MLIPVPNTAFKKLFAVFFHIRVYFSLKRLMVKYQIETKERNLWNLLVIQKVIFMHLKKKKKLKKQNKTKHQKAKTNKTRKHNLEIFVFLKTDRITTSSHVCAWIS